jgi:hypothetical protein
MALNGDGSLGSINIDLKNKSYIEFYDIFDVKKGPIKTIKEKLHGKLIENCGGIFEDKFYNETYIPRLVLPLNLWVDSRKWQPEQLPGQQKKSIPSSNPAVWVSTKKTSAGKGERDAAQVYTESDSIASWLCVRSHPFG